MEVAGVATAIPGLRFSSPFRYRCHDWAGTLDGAVDRNPVAFDARRAAESHQALRSRMIGSHLGSRNLPVRFVCGRRGLVLAGIKLIFAR
jgi:hypothetical protein